MRGIIATVFVALLLTACAGPKEVPTALEASLTPSTAASSPSPTPSPSPTIMSKAAAKQAYLAAVCPGNANVVKLYHLVAGKYPSQMNVKKIRATAKMGVKEQRREYVALTSPELPWPKNVSKDIPVIAASTLDAIDDVQDLADARSGSEIVTAWNNLAEQSPKTRRAVQKVRLLLGLPPSGSGKSGCP